MQVEIATCEKCGHEWIMRVTNPIKCPKCGHIRGSNVRKKAEAAKFEGETAKAQATPMIEGVTTHE